MNYKLVKIERLSGNKASIYTLLPEDGTTTTFETFIRKNSVLHKKEVGEIFARLKVMGTKTGVKTNFVKLDEGKPGDGVCAVFDPEESNLRLYGIRYGSSLILVGGGSDKPKEIRGYQQKKDLKDEADLMIKLSAQITLRMREKEIQLINDPLDFDGDLNFQL